MSMNDLTALVNQYKEAQQLAEAAAAEMEALKDQLKAELAARSTESMTVGTHKVSCVTVTSSRLDSKALKAAAPDLAERFTKTTTSTRFLVA